MRVRPGRMVHRILDSHGDEAFELTRGIGAESLKAPDGPAFFGGENAGGCIPLYSRRSSTALPSSTQARRTL